MASAKLYQLSHCTYICRYHLVWTTKYRGKVLADDYIKQEMKRIFKMIAKWKDMKIHAWHIGDEHIHLYLTISPKFSVAYCVAILKGKSSAWIKKKTKKLPKGTLWTRGYFVSTIGLNEFVIKKYIENQKRYQVEQPALF